MSIKRLTTAAANPGSGGPTRPKVNDAAAI
jgi:hypothetical protein